MKDQEKAQSITNTQEWIWDLTDENNLNKEDRNQIRFKIYDALLEMAAWKEKQMIEKMKNCVKGLYLPAYSYLDRENSELIQDIKEAMMEE